MAVDASKLKRRRGLGVPPTDGAPGIEDTVLELEAYHPPQPAFLDRTFAASSEAQAGDAREPSPPPEPVSAANPIGARAEPELSEKEPAIPPRRAAAPALAERGRGGEGTLARRQRVPPPEAEPRVPFTTRVTVSTKERLEDACYHLRRKHQDFINEAILAHLKRHGF